jgi:hypothetical protein
MTEVMQTLDATDRLKHLTGELENFEDIARYLLPQPGEVPKLHGIDLYGGTMRGSPTPPRPAGPRWSRTSSAAR